MVIGQASSIKGNLQVQSAICMLIGVITKLKLAIVGKDFEGYGLATKACEVFTKHAFTALQLNKVEINMASTNIKSKAIPERLGFKEEGRIRNHEFLHGEYLDRTTFGLLKDEWMHR